ncbi:MAG: CBS domain-containing protein [Candidatus Heimdallarchaeota archaeon]|nr:CBS domain-containing protein [Candidatus Heimdallarchaeota archaeon]MBY8993634.1 CBS domain-containing protein [Candidatus Heimdallarchaeota archaeon]
MRDDISSDSRLKMEVSEVMTTTVFSIFQDQTVQEAAKLMLDKSVGCIIIQPRKGEKTPLGIITERDIVTRVVAIGKEPKDVIVDEIATKPVVTANPSLDVAKAMSLMAKLNIRRLIIVENNNVVGIVTYRDLLRIAPGLLEIAMEYEKIGFRGETEDDTMDFADEDYDKDSELNQPDLSLGYYCSSCGEWNEGDPAYDKDDQALCSDCQYLDEEINE